MQHFVNMLHRFEVSSQMLLRLSAEPCHVIVMALCIASHAVCTVTTPADTSLKAHWMCCFQARKVCQLSLLASLGVSRQDMC